MADDLMDFSEMDENDENADPDVVLAPKLMQTPVIKNSILKQSTKDNLIQLFTPVQKNKKLKVHFTCETPHVSADTVIEKNVDGADNGTSQETTESERVAEEEERENWVERTSVLTKQDHQDYIQYASEFLLDIISNLPIKEEEPHTDSGIDVSMMDTQDDMTDLISQPPADSDGDKIEGGVDVQLLSEAEDLLKMLRGELGVLHDQTDTNKNKASVSNGHAEAMDFDDEPMDVDVSVVQSQEKTATPEQECEIPLVSSKQDEIARDIITTSEEKVMENDLLCEEKENKANILVKEDQIENVMEGNSIGIKSETRADNHNVNNDVPNVAANTDYGATKTNILEIFDDTHVKQNSEESQPFIDNRREIDDLGSENVQTVNDAKANDNNKETVSEDKRSRVDKNKKNDENSSDEEFLSADEDMVNEQNKEIESPGRTPPKVSYNFNFDDLESLNPFQTKACVQNSPSMITSKDKVHVDAKTVNSGEENNDNADSKVIESSTGIITTHSEENCIEISQSHISESEKEKNDEEDSLGKIVSSDIKDGHAHEQMPLQESGADKKHDCEIIEHVESRKLEDKQSIAEEVTKSPPPAQKGSYNLDDMDSIDPFKPREQMMNSPVSKSPPLPQKGSYNLDDLDSIDPFKPRGQMMNSPVEKHKGDNRQTHSEIDPFMPRKQNLNSPEDKSTDHHTQQNQCLLEQESVSHSKEGNTNVIVETPKSAVTKTKISKPQVHEKENKNSLPENLDEINTLKSENEIMNSPGIKPLPEDLESLDPFKPKHQMMNSPVSIEKCPNDVKECQNVGEITVNKSKTTNVLESKDDSKPFKCSEQGIDLPLASGLPENLDEIDPFKPKKQIMNSPDKVSVDMSLPDNLDEIDPFKPKKQMINSPLIDKKVDKNRFPESSGLPYDTDPFQTSSEIMDFTDAALKDSLPESLEDIDPFKPKTQIANSPAKALTTVALPDTLEDIDPFKPRNQMLNSPVTGNDKIISDNTDPVNPMNKVMNSTDLKKKSSELPEGLEESDPFKSRNQIQNSPTTKDPSDSDKKNVKNDAFDDIDPFKPKSQIQNSPKSNKENNLDSIDPFKPRNAMLNSPAGIRGVGTPKSALSPFINRTTRLPPTPEETLGSEDEVVEVQGVTWRGSEAATNPQGFDIDESEFVAASEVFKDPGVWEILEQFGSNSASNPSQESTLSRMSLYVKFDPLVDSSRMSVNARRISIKPKQLEKVKEYGLDETLLLLGTPPKKKRQSMNVSQLRHTPVSRSLATEEGPKRHEMSIAQGAVDLIMSMSPEEPISTSSNKMTSQQSSLLAALDDNSGAGIFEELKYTDSDLRRLQRDMKLEFQGQLIVKEKEWFEEKSHFERKLKDAEAAIEAEKKKSQEMAKAYCMFEETIQGLIAIQEKDKKQIADKNKENQQIREDIQSVENAFSDLHRRYEKLKTVVVGNLQNEETLKKHANDLKENLKKSEEKYASLKKTAEEKISKYMQENEKLKNEISGDQSKHDAAKKMMTLKIENLERQLEQKIDENKNLTEICDQLIQKAEK